jgi:hypothetical protein
MRKALFVFLAAIALPAVANADGDGQPDPSRDPQVARLLGAKNVLKWNQTLGGKDRYGHAEVLVDAPVDVVVKKAQEFGKYKELHRKFATARVVAKEGDNTDVYMRYPVQLGPMTFELHEVMRFAPMHAVGSSFVMEGRGIQGDMSKGHSILTIKPVDAKHAVLAIDILLEPKIPAPQSFIDEELRDGAGDFVNGLKDKSQGWSGFVTSL